MSEQLLALLIDDEPLFRKSLDFVLRKFGFVAVSVGTPAEFLEALSRTQPSVVMIDLNLGEFGSGFSLIEEVRKQKGGSVPVIMISASDDTKSIAHAMEIGASEFIRKPVDKQFLATKLARWVQSRGIVEHQGHYQEVPDRNIPARIHLPFEIQEIDELGVKLIGKHLLAKGSALKIEGGLIQEIAADGKARLVNVVSTWMEPEGEFYGAYAEFDNTDSVFMQNIRRWLGTKLGQSEQQ